MSKPMTKSTTKNSSTASLFDDPNIPVVGGQYDQLKLEIGEVSPMLVYERTTFVNLTNDEGGQESTKSPVARIEETGELVSLPISAVFRRHFADAGVSIGERFAIKRYPDAVKKAGKGAGQKMKIFALAFPDRTIDGEDKAGE
jgi:hypothetical protein